MGWLRLRNADGDAFVEVEQIAAITSRGYDEDRAPVTEVTLRSGAVVVVRGEAAAVFQACASATRDDTPAVARAAAAAPQAVGTTVRIAPSVEDLIRMQSAAVLPDGITHWTADQLRSMAPTDRAALAEALAQHTPAAEPTDAQAAEEAAAKAQIEALMARANGAKG